MASRPRVSPMGTSSLARRNIDRSARTSLLEQEEKVFFANSLCEMTAKTIRVVFLVIAIVIFAFSIAATFTSIVTLPHNTYYTPWSICVYENGTSPVNSGPSPPSPFFQAVCQQQIRHTMSETCNRFLHLSDVAKATGIIGAIFSTFFYFCALFMKPIPRESRKKKLLRKLHKRRGKPSNNNSNSDDIGSSWLAKKSGGAAAVPDMTSDPYAITDTTSPSRATAAPTTASRATHDTSTTTSTSSHRQRRFFPLWCLVLLYINFFMYLIAGICCTLAVYSPNCADRTTTFAQSGFKLGPCGLLLWIGFGLTFVVLVMERSSSHEVFTEEGDAELIGEGESEYHLEDVVISGSFVSHSESAAVNNDHKRYGRDRDIDLNFSSNSNCDCQCDGCEHCCDNCCDSCNNCCQRCSRDCSDGCDCIMKDCECCCRECCQCCNCCRGDCRCDCTDANCRACNCGEGDCSSLCGNGSCDCASCDCGSCDCGSCDVGGCGDCGGCNF